MPAPRVITLAAGQSQRKLARNVARALNRGQIVALPTETVYGLCCRSAFEGALERIFQLKKRDPAKALPFLIPDGQEIFNFVNDVPFGARKLMSRFWPGPLTLVLGPDPGVALRVPDHDFTREVLRRSKGPVHGTSANRSGDPAAVTAQQVLEAFPEGLDLVVDGGDTAPGEASTIVRLSPSGAWSLLREGATGADSIAALLRTTIVLVCTGNTCRSPMAAAALRRLLGERLGTRLEEPEESPVRVESAGVAAGFGSPMTHAAEAALDREGISVPNHRSQPFSAELAEEADLVLAMTPGHVASLESRFPDLRPRLRLLDPDGATIRDPIGGGETIYTDCLDLILAALEARLDFIASLINPTGGGRTSA